MGVGPTIEVLLRVRRDGAELGFLPAGRHDELAVVEERRIPFPLGPALLAVAEELVDGLGNRVLYLGRFALDHYYGEAVEEQHDVGVMWCSVPRTRTLNWQTALKRLLSRVTKSA